jgi:hypothetical protein
MIRRSLSIAILLGAVTLAVAGCGSSEGGTDMGNGAAQLEREMRQQRAEHRTAMQRHARMAARRRHARMMTQRRHRAEVRQLRVEEAERVAAEEAVEEEASECDPNYAGACLDPSVSDYDCEGGSGNGPYYTGTVTVVGEDHYGLDADSDGTGCEP